MKYEFATIESLIRDAFDEKDKSTKSFEERFAGIRNAVASERDRIKKSFALLFWGLESDQARQNYFQFHFQGLIYLIDELFDASRQFQSKKRDSNERLEKEAFFLYDILEDILTFLQERLPEYVSPGIKMPEPQRRRIVKEFQDGLNLIQSSETQSLGSALKVCKQQIQELFEGRKSQLTYGTAKYLRRLILSIRELLQTEGINTETEIEALLISLNFNSKDFFRYVVGSIQGELDQADSDATRMEKMLFRLKKINQVSGERSIAFNPSNRSLSALLSEWLSEEVAFLERRRDFAANTQATEKEFASKGFKLEFDMSVAQFAYFIRMFIETGVIQNKNISELIRFLAKFVKTKRSENISYESFRMKYYNVESGTKDTVKNTLHTAIGFINSN